METRSIDGSGNNPINPLWGAAGQHLIRLVPAAYPDGIHAPTGEARPSPRLISNVIFTQRDVIPSTRRLSNLTWAWGQFLDHELDLTPEDDENAFDIETPNDPRGAFIPLNRSRTVGQAPREQINALSSFIDAANIYGVTEVRLRALRANDGSGKLRTSDPQGRFLPYNDQGLENFPGGPSPRVGPTSHSRFFLSGDIRANEHVVLSSMHTLFMREHNRRAEALRASNPSMSGDTIFELSRKWVAAVMQVITYQEFLPALLGADAIPEYIGYRPDVDPGISNVFSTACYRLGHTMLSEQIDWIGRDAAGNEIARTLSLGQAFAAPELIADPRQTSSTQYLGIRQLLNGGIEPFLVGLTRNRQQQIDANVVDSVRNFLFRFMDSGGAFRDLISLNIQRGRDHGLADYNTYREALGLPRKRSFAEVTANPQMSTALQSVYPSIDDIDVFVGAMIEDHVLGAAVGELVRTVLVDQFTRIRDGDRFWYENDRSISTADIEQLRQTTLTDVILRNCDVPPIAVPKYGFYASRPEQNAAEFVGIRFHNTLRFSDCATPGRARSGPQMEILHLDRVGDRVSIIGDSRNAILGRYCISEDGVDFYRIVDELPSEVVLPRGVSFFPAQGSVAIFTRNGKRHLRAAGYDFTSGSCNGWIFQAVELQSSESMLLQSPPEPTTETLEPLELQMSNALEFFECPSPGPEYNRDAGTETLTVVRRGELISVCDGAENTGSNVLFGRFMFRLGAMDVYSILDGQPPSEASLPTSNPAAFPYPEGKRFFAAQGVVVLAPSDSGYRLRAAGVDSLSGSCRGWIFTATEISDNENPS